jgi:hypothetical protein
MRRLFFPLFAFLWCLAPALAMSPVQVVTVTPAWQDGGWSGFTPNSLLAAYWRADTLSDGAVASWADDVGAFALTQATGGAQPVKAATTCNGTPGVTFDGTDDTVRANATTGLPTGTNEGWIFVSAVVGVVDTNLRTAFSYGTQNAGSRRTLNKSGAAIQRYSFTDQGATVNDSGSAYLSPELHVLARHTGAGGTLIEGFIDGRPTSIPSSVATSNTGTTRTAIGADLAATAASFWQGVVCDVAVRSGALTDFQRQQIVAYFAWLRRVPYVLPYNHPFRWRRP